MSNNKSKASFKIDDILGRTQTRHTSLPNCCSNLTSNYNLFSSLIHHKKCRRTRTVFSDAQLIGLEKRFESQKYLSTPDRIQLASYLGLSQLQVKTWYQNRRMKWKKQVMREGRGSRAPTKPKGRPKKNSIPSLDEILAAQQHQQQQHGSKVSIDNDSNYISNDEDDDENSHVYDDDYDDNDSRIDVVGV